MERAPSLARLLMDLGPINPREIDPADARRTWNAYRIDNGATSKDRPFTLPGSTNTKLKKSQTRTHGLTLLPASASGAVNTCTNATWGPDGCGHVCVLMTSGKGTLASVRDARGMRTRFLAEHPKAAVSLMFDEITAEAANAGDLLVRLNVASDLPWEVIAPDLFTIPGARFYDYTKVPARVREPFPGYRLVFSFSSAQHSSAVATEYLDRGGTVAVVFATKRGHDLPAAWRGYPVIDGDATDDRTVDPAGTVVGLRAKGSAINLPVGGFVQPGTAIPVSVV